MTFAERIAEAKAQELQRKMAQMELDQQIVIARNRARGKALQQARMDKMVRHSETKRDDSDNG